MGGALSPDLYKIAAKEAVQVLITYLSIGYKFIFY